MKNKKDLLRLGLMATGAVFLFNPTVNIIDPLPDLIGFWIMAYAMTAVSCLSERLYEARRRFVYLAFLEAAKLAVFLLVPGATGSFVVLMAFSFAVLEAVLFLPAVSDLFEGISSMGIRYSSESLFFVPPSAFRRKKAERLLKRLSVEGDAQKRSAMEKKLEGYKRLRPQSYLKTFTAVAFVIRALGAVVP
ncbi:MAG: hypothetical protein IJD22_01605, partial [Clostridia bacterium]|nr:hypothetical protein [Clostridia bacterium]